MKIDFDHDILNKAAKEYSDLQNKSDDNPIMQLIYSAFKHWSERMLFTLKEGIIKPFITAEVKIIKIGKLTIVTLPFEVFHDIGLKIKKHFGINHTMVLGYTNGLFGYMASKSQYDYSKYEVNDSYKIFGYPGSFCKNAEDIILDAIKNIE